MMSEVYISHGVEFTEEEIFEHRNKFAEVADRRILPRSLTIPVKRTGKCTACGKPSGPYTTCALHRETAKVFRALKELEAEGELIRVTDGRGKKGGSTWKIKPKTPYVRAEPKIGRNEKCTCGSGKKYKHCCLLQKATK